jgi:hypothetical protein
MALPWSSALDVSYVGSHGCNLMNQFNQPIDLNAPDLGAALQPQNQDPTLAPSNTGASALSTDLLRPYRGFGRFACSRAASGRRSIRSRRPTIAGSAMAGIPRKPGFLRNPVSSDHSKHHEPGITLNIRESPARAGHATRKPGFLRNPVSFIVQATPAFFITASVVS